MGRARRTKDGPRQATRWIGDVFIVDDLSRTARAVWRGGASRAPQLAKARLEGMVLVEDEFRYAVMPHLAASVLGGDNIVPRFVTYRSENSLLVIEHDLADLTLRDVMDALHGGGSVPAGLAVYVARAMVRACRGAWLQGGVRIDLSPRNVDVAWNGALYLRPAAVGEDDDGIRWDDDVVERVSYWPGATRTVGVVMYELLSGKHPFYDGDEDSDDDDIVADITARMQSAEYEPLEVDVPEAINALIEQLLDSESAFASWDALDQELNATVAVDPFEMTDLAGMMRGLFADKKRACEIEREDRLQVLPGPKVEPEEWRVFDADNSGDDEDDFIADLDDVRHGRGEETRYEPSVDPIDPFENE